MIDVSLFLRHKAYLTDEIGNEVENIQEVEVPIVKIGQVYANEFYQASQAGFKPTMRFTISSLNYNNEDELRYCDSIYSIVRVDSLNLDEKILVCERKIGEYRN